MSSTDVHDTSSDAAIGKESMKVEVMIIPVSDVDRAKQLLWLSIPRSGAYCAAKSAEWSLTNALRLELGPRGTRVTALVVGYMDTDMTRGLDVPKSGPAAIAKLAVDGITAGDAEVVADETSKRILAGLSAGVAGLYPQVA